MQFQAVLLFDEKPENRYDTMMPQAKTLIKQYEIKKSPRWGLRP
jgi:hypothetical protein